MASIHTINKMRRIIAVWDSKTDMKQIEKAKAVLRASRRGTSCAREPTLDDIKKA